MASKERATCGVGSNVPARQPARVKVTGNGGETINVNIQKITGSVSVANVSSVTHYHLNPSTVRGGQWKTHRSCDWADRDSSDSDSSSSDSESESFFAAQGVKMPTKMQWREMSRNMKEMARNGKQMKNQAGSANRVHTVIVDKGQTSAFDRNGKVVRLQPQNGYQLTNGRSDSDGQGSRSTARPANIHGQRTFVTRNNSNPRVPLNYVGNNSGQMFMDRQLAAPADQPTTYEKQTQKFEQIMKELPNRTLDDAMIYRISSHIGKGWRRVFRHLNFADGVIDGAYQDCGQVQETVYRLLVQWKRAAATPERTLVEALVRAEQLHVIQLFHS